MTAHEACPWVHGGMGVTERCHLPKGHEGEHDFYRCVADLPTCPVCPKPASAATTTESGGPTFEVHECPCELCDCIELTDSDGLCLLCRTNVHQDDAA